MPTKKQLGAQGEDLAVKFLAGKGYLILERNYYIQSGEIDIIAQDKKANEFVFVHLFLLLAYFLLLFQGF